MKIETDKSHTGKLINPPGLFDTAELGVRKSVSILDACCGSRMFWFDKHNENVLFADKRKESHVLCDSRTLEISPDVQIDFRNMPFDDNTFLMVVFDPPHLNKLGHNSWMAKKYGILDENWEQDIKQGLNECMRVVQSKGTVIFKWNTTQISLNKILSVIDHKPLFGHVTGKHQSTIWMAFIKDL